jgi:carbon storage regulator
MLVLSRKLSQQVMIGSDISITVVRIDRNHVRIGISAPPGVSVLRQELIEKRERVGRHPTVQPRPIEAKPV